MEKYINNKNKILATRNMLITALVIFIVAVSLVGATNAWFYEEASTNQREFAAGTIQLGEPVLTDEPNGSDCRILTWEFDYLGTKDAFIRVRPWISEVSGSESLWTEGAKIQDKSPGKGSPASYVYYEKGSRSADAPEYFNLGYGQNYTKAGDLKVWDDSDTDTIVIEFNTENNYPMVKSDLYVGINKPFSPAPGNYGFKEADATSVMDYQHIYNLDTIYQDQKTDSSTPGKEYSELSNGDIIYIAGHTDVETVTTGDSWEVWIPDNLSTGCSVSWLKGNDGWWYTRAAGIGSEGSISHTLAICFEVCNKSGKNNFYLEAEAVQVTHGAIDAEWGSSYPPALIE